MLSRTKENNKITTTTGTGCHSDTAHTHRNWDVNQRKRLTVRIKSHILIKA